MPEDTPESREVTLEQAIGCLERLGMIHNIQPGKSDIFHRWGVAVENGGTEAVQVIVLRGA